MGRYMANESLDAAITAIVEKELTEYKERLKVNVAKHCNNPYCSKTDFGSVMYEKEILDLIDKIS